MVCGIVCADATATCHITDGPVEQLEVCAVRGDDVELIDLWGKETLSPEAGSIPEELTGVVAATFYVSLQLDDPDALRITRGTVLVVRTEEVVEHVTVFTGLRAETLGHQFQVGITDDGCSGADGLIVCTCGEIGLSQQHVGSRAADLTITHTIDIGQAVGRELQILNDLCPHLVFRLTGIVGLGGRHFLELKWNVTIEQYECAVAQGTEKAGLSLILTLLCVIECGGVGQTADDGVGLCNQLVVLIPIELGDGA